MAVSASIAVAAAATVYSVSEAQSARKDAKSEMKKQNANQLKLEDDLKNRQMNEKATETQAILRLRQQSQRMGAAGGTPRSTVLGASAGKKTVLGA